MSSCGREGGSILGRVRVLSQSKRWHEIPKGVVDSQTCRSETCHKICVYSLGWYFIAWCIRFIEPPGLSRLRFEAPSLWPQRCTKGSYLQLSMARTSKVFENVLFSGDDLGDGGVLCSWVAVEFHFNTSEKTKNFFIRGVHEFCIRDHRISSVMVVGLVMMHRPWVTFLVQLREGVLDLGSFWNMKFCCISLLLQLLVEVV